MDQIFDKIPYERLEEVNPLHIFAGAAGLGVLLFVISYFTLVGAVREEHAQLQDKKVKTENTLNQYRNVVGQKDRVFREFTRASGELSAAKREMPAKEEMPDFLRKITLVGKALNVKMLTFEVKEGTVRDYFIEIPVRMVVRGDLWSTMDFMESIQNMLRLVDFTDLEMSVKNVEESFKGRKSETEALFTEFTAKTYVYVEGAEAKSDAE